MVHRLEFWKYNAFEVSVQMVGSLLLSPLSEWTVHAGTASDYRVYFFLLPSNDHHLS